MKKISASLTVAALAVGVGMIAQPVKALYMPISSNYCLYVAVAQYAGYREGCGYTKNECLRYAAAIKSQHPNYRTTCS